MYGLTSPKFNINRLNGKSFMYTLKEDQIDVVRKNKMMRFIAAGRQIDVICACTPSSSKYICRIN